MTIELTAPVYRMCASGQHEMSPDNIKPHNGRRYCRACDTAARHEREARVRTKMRLLLTGFAYWPRPGWHGRAVCRDADPLLFQCGEKSDESENRSADMVSRERHTEARDYCEVCPVVAQCLGEALMMRDTGTRGGELLTPTDWKISSSIVKELGL
jgi:hypothetical protein